MGVESNTGSGQFSPGEMIIGHVSNSSIEHPIIALPTLFGIDFSVTKHLLMLWIVSSFLLIVITWPTRRYLKQNSPLPKRFMNGLEVLVLFVRDSMVLPNVGKKFVNTWTPLILTFFFFIMTANAMGLIPIFELLGVADRFFLKTGDHSFINQVLHGGTTATANYNVTAALATITFVAIILAGSKAHGFFQHWKNMAPSGMAWPLYFILIPIEVIGMFVKPFALTMRLAANMIGGHIAILAILSFVFIFSGQYDSVVAGISVGAIVSVPLAVAISALELIVVLVQAYVFSLLSAVFIGLSVKVHH